MNNREFCCIVTGSTIVTVLAAVLCFFLLTPATSLVCLLLGSLLTGFFTYYTKKRYERIADLNRYLSRVLLGNYNLDVWENEEGELSILKNNLYKVIVLLRSQNEKLAKDKVYLADSLADISHQLKTPLTSMTVMADVLKEEKDPEKQAKFVSIIEQQLGKMNWLIQNLLKLSKLDAGTILLKDEKISIGEVLEESCRPFLVQMDIRGIVLELPDHTFMFRGDKNWSEEAFGNIVKNCVEHMKEGGRLRIQLEETTLYDAVIITDTGCGIRQEDLPHIFERFYHGKNASAESVGIGLAMTKAILEKERGEITAESEEGKGTRFVVKFYKAII